MKITKRKKILKSQFGIFGQIILYMSIIFFLFTHIPLYSKEKNVDQRKNIMMSAPKDSLLHNLTHRNSLKKIREVVSLEDSSNITIPFPEQWPPKKPTVVYYLYRYGSPAKTGIEATYIGSPFLLIKVSLKESGKLEISTSKLNSKPLPVLEPISSFFPSDKLKEEEALSLLFDSIAKGIIPDNEASYKIRQFYREWTAAHPALYSYFKNLYPKFFDWIESEEKNR